jgi:hypothetical protein
MAGWEVGVCASVLAGLIGSFGVFSPGLGVLLSVTLFGLVVAGAILLAGARWKLGVGLLVAAALSVPAGYGAIQLRMYATYRSIQDGGRGAPGIAFLAYSHHPAAWEPECRFFAGPLLTTCWSCVGDPGVVCDD